MINLKKNIGWLISKLIYEWNPWKIKRKKNFYKKFIQANHLCFDVGAHLGDRTSTWLELGASVVGFEPQPRFSEYIQKKFGSHPKYTHEAIGVGQHKGKATMHISSMYPTLSSLAGEAWMKDVSNSTALNINFDQELEVPTNSLDAMMLKHGVPNFIKIDVEGYEINVLMGLSQKVDFISFEFLSFNKDELIACLDRLKELGYQEFNWSYAETFRLVFENWKSSDEIIRSIENFKQGTFSGDVYAKA